MISVLYSPGGMKLLQEAAERDPEQTGIIFLGMLAVSIIVFGIFLLVRHIRR